MRGKWSLGIAIPIILTLACCTAPDSNGTATQNVGGTTAINKSEVLKDGNGIVLGYVTDANSFEVTVLTSQGFFVTLTWKGIMPDNVGYYTGANGTGTLFYISLSSNYYNLLGFTISLNGQVYVAASLDSSGFAIADASITGYQSFYMSGSITNATSTVPATESAYSLKAASLADIGLPSSCALPLQLVSQ